MIQNIWPATLYVIGEPGGVTPVKIGVCTDVSTRLKLAQANSPVGLAVLAAMPGRLQHERSLHAKHWAARSHGEWFFRTAEVMADVEAIASGVFDLSALPKVASRAHVEENARRRAGRAVPQAAA